MIEGTQLTQEWVNKNLTDGHNVSIGEKVIYAEDLEELIRVNNELTPNQEWHLESLMSHYADSENLPYPSLHGLSEYMEYSDGPDLTEKEYIQVLQVYLTRISAEVANDPDEENYKK